MSLPRVYLKAVPNVEGIYGASKTFFPRSAALLHPEAAAAYERACSVVGRLRVSDIFRTPEQSLQARSEKTGVQPPGFSAHNFGLAIDVDVLAMLERTRLTKPDLDARMASCGWHCHRKDGMPGAEWWHYNYLGPDARPFLAVSASSSNTSAAADARIVALYRTELELDPHEAQECLAKLGLYQGAIDGVPGKRTEQAVRAFQRAWQLPDDGKLGPRTQRTLAIVAAERVVVP